MNAPDPKSPEHTEAVQRLFLQHTDVLQGFIAGLVPDLGRAQDVFQEVFLTINRRASEFRLGTQFMAWARAIAWRKCQESFRTSKSGARPLDDKIMESLVASAAETPDGWIRRREALTACLEQLAPRAREVVALRYSEGLLTPQEIAKRLSWTAHAVDVALSRARKGLRECTQRALGPRPV